MRNIVLSLLLLSTASLYSSEDQSLDIEALFEPVLHEQSLRIEEVHIDPNWIEFSSSHTLKPFQILLMQEPLKAPNAVQTLSSLIAESHSVSFSGFLTNFSILQNYRAQYTTKIADKNHLPSKEEFIRMVEGLQQSYNPSHQVHITEFDEGLEAAFEQLPESLRTVIFQLLLTLEEAWSWLALSRNSIRHLSTIEEIEAIYNKSSYTNHDIVLLSRFDADFDRKSMYLSAQAITDWLTDTIHTLQTDEIDLNHTVQFTTAFGTIHLAGERQDTSHHFDVPPLLLIDFFGDDTYQHNYAIANATTPFSITIDMEGNDHYHSEEPNDRSASASFGTSALIDLSSGDDTFTGHSRCMGYSFAGASIVYDASGASTYSIHSSGLGASDFGVAMLIDSGGDDSYKAYYKSQGAGFVDGVGFLLDTDGNDQYIAHATPVVVQSAQLPQQNFSASQGFGTGRFGPLHEGYTLQGGLGMLIDSTGDDTYQASVFAQGAGYGYGIGIVSDLAGDDSYTCSWYGVGAAAHQASGILLDVTGSDTVTASHYMVGGAAIDLGLGVYINQYGNDTYHAQNASFGYGLDNSIVLFADLFGDDCYHVTNGLGMGWAANKRSHTLRGLWSTFGLFYDGEGMNTTNQSIHDNSTKPEGLRVHRIRILQQ